MTVPTRRADRGFTMMEVIVAVAVVAIIAAVAFPVLMFFEDRARTQATERELAALEEALAAYYEDYGSYPADLTTLESQGYLRGRLNTDVFDHDAWFRDYQFTTAGATATVASQGADMQFSTPDDISITVNATSFFRRSTRDEMATIRIALRNYEAVRSGSSLPSLPSHWNDQGGSQGAFRMLADQGLLPDDDGFQTDAWGSLYVYTGTPSTIVTSPNVTTYWSDDGGGGGSSDDDSSDGGSSGGGGSDDDSSDGGSDGGSGGGGSDDSSDGGSGGGGGSDDDSSD